MNHVNELCCDACREKVQQIEARARAYAQSSAEGMIQVIEDRAELLMMLETLLATVAAKREQWRAMAVALGKMDDFIAALPGKPA